MTTKQIERAIKKAGIVINTEDVKISRDEVEVRVGYHVEENNGRQYGNCHARKTAILRNKILKALQWTSYFSTAYGAAILQREPALFNHAD